MATKVKSIPEGGSAVTPYLSCANATEMIDFYKKAFGATEKFRLTQPDGRIGHAEIAIGGALLMLADEFPEMGFLSPKSELLGMRLESQAIRHRHNVCPLRRHHPHARFAAGG